MRHRFGRQITGLLMLLSAAGVFLVGVADSRTAPPGPRDREWVKARPDPAARPRIEAAFRTSSLTAQQTP